MGGSFISIVLIGDKGVFIRTAGTIRTNILLPPVPALIL